MKFLKNKLKDVGAWPTLYATQFSEKFCRWVGEKVDVKLVPYDAYYDFERGVITVEDDSSGFPYYHPNYVHTIEEPVVFENLKALYDIREGEDRTRFKFASQLLVCEKCGVLLPDTNLAEAPEIPDDFLYDGAEFTDDLLLFEAACAAIRGSFFQDAVCLSACETKCSHKPHKKVPPIQQKEKDFFQLHQATSQLPHLCTPTK
jgi:hypothetical protein